MMYGNETEFGFQSIYLENTEQERNHPTKEQLDFLSTIEKWWLLISTLHKEADLDLQNVRSQKYL